MRPKIKTFDASRSYQYAHLKRDGIWLELSGGQGAGPLQGCWTRHPTDLYHQLSHHPTVMEFFRRAADDRDIVRFYCELYAPGRPQSAVKSLLANGEMGGLVIEAFASPDLVSDAPLHHVAVYASKFGVPFNNSYHLMRDLDAAAREAIYDHLLHSPDSEGVVYKDGNLWNWSKRKAEPTTDLIIIGYTEGRPGKTGKMLGKVGALKLGLYIPPYMDEYATGGTVMLGNRMFSYVCNCSGMDDAVRDEITANRDAYLGKVVEVRYQYVGSGGGLRHPRFVRFRDDKRPEECTEI